jgi:hypothetical protein
LLKKKGTCFLFSTIISVSNICCFFKNPQP